MKYCVCQEKEPVEIVNRDLKDDYTERKVTISLFPARPLLAYIERTHGGAPSGQT